MTSLRIQNATNIVEEAVGNYGGPPRAYDSRENAIVPVPLRSVKDPAYRVSGSGRCDFSLPVTNIEIPELTEQNLSEQFMNRLANLIEGRSNICSFPPDWQGQAKLTSNGFLL